MNSLIIAGRSRMLCMKAWVYGKVQGVGYRMFCRRQARDLGIRGYAINLEDGRVEVMMVGTEPQLAAMLDALHEGPRFSQVLGVDVERVDPGVPPPEGFVMG